MPFYPRKGRSVTNSLLDDLSIQGFAESERPSLALSRCEC